MTLDSSLFPSQQDVWWSYENKAPYITSPRAPNNQILVSVQWSEPPKIAEESVFAPPPTNSESPFLVDIHGVI